MKRQSSQPGMPATFFENADDEDDDEIDLLVGLLWMFRWKRIDTMMKTLKKRTCTKRPTMMMRSPRWTFDADFACERIAPPIQI
jgi:hypothetical protein